MRTPDEIVARMKELQDHAVWPFFWEILGLYLDYEHAGQVMRHDVTKEQWESVQRPLTEADVLGRMRNYMPHAWRNVKEHRGISASMAVDKIKLWLWLLGDDELYAFASDDRNYAYYGAPILAAVCRKYGFPIPTGKRVARMVQGLPCRPNCVGCTSD